MNDTSKFFLYSNLKSDIQIVKRFFFNEPHSKNRQNVTNFLVSDHTLEAEIGRYKKYHKEKRLLSL